VRGVRAAWRTLRKARQGWHGGKVSCVSSKRWVGHAFPAGEPNFPGDPFPALVWVEADWVIGCVQTCEACERVCMRL